MESRLCALLMAGLFTVSATRPLCADTLDELHACLQDRLATHDVLTWAFDLGVLRCLEDWEAQKGDVNITIDPGSPGYRTLRGVPMLLIEPGTPATAVFAVHASDPPTGIDLHLLTADGLPPPPGFGEVVGSDTDPDDGWSITFDTDALGDFRGVLLARAHFPGHDEQIDGDQAVIVIGTSLPQDVPEAMPMDIAVTGLSLEVVDDAVQSILTYELAVGDDYSPSLPLVAEIAVNGAVVGTTTLAPEVFGASLSCYTSPAPPCNGECPFDVECKLIRIEIDDILIDQCACNYLEDWWSALPAAPGDLVTIRLDADDAWAEIDETNNVAAAYVPQATALDETPRGRLITGAGNHPNPFNPRTALRFTLATAADVRIEITDMQGRRVKGFARTRYPAGPSHVEWHGHDDAGRLLPSGIYNYRIQAGGETVSGTMAIIK